MSEISDVDDLSGMLPYEILAEITSRDARIAALEAALGGIEESADKWAGMVADQGEANIHALHRDMARAALAGEGQG